jgi:hypothetical protein
VFPRTDKEAEDSLAFTSFSSTGLSLACLVPLAALLGARVFTIPKLLGLLKLRPDLRITDLRNLTVLDQIK